MHPDSIMEFKEPKIKLEFYLISKGGYLVGPFDSYLKAAEHAENEGEIDSDGVRLQGLDLEYEKILEGRIKLPRVVFKEL